MNLDFAENNWVWVTGPEFYYDRVFVPKNKKERTKRIASNEELNHLAQKGKKISGKPVKGKIQLEERKGLDPGNDFSESWWTCHKDTKKGDLVLLYRKSPMSDIKYLFRATSDSGDPYDKIENFDKIKEPGWDHVCSFESLYKFRTPLTYQEMKKTQKHPQLKHWGALNGKFHRKAFLIPDFEFKHLIDVLTKKNPYFENVKSKIKPLQMI